MTDATAATPWPDHAGIYALIDLNGAPLDRADAQRLGLPSDAAGAVRLVDAAAPWALCMTDDDAGLTVLCGDIEDATDTAAALGLGRGAAPSRIARAALSRHGGDTPAQLTGEWTLLHWNRVERTIIVMVSAARRDMAFFVWSNGRLAVSPDVERLARIGGRTAAPDEAVVLARMGTQALRRPLAGRSIWKGVGQVEPGEGLWFSAGGTMRRTCANSLPDQPLWQGTAGETLEQAGALLRHIAGARLSRAGTAACLLSGGLDSSLVALALADAADDRAAITFLTSVAPPGSGIADELPFADSVAQALGSRATPVWPPLDADTYCPAPSHLAGMNGPILSNRLCLTDAFHAAARTYGARILVNGGWGEWTLSSYGVNFGRPTLRQRAGHMLRRFQPRPDALTCHMHVRLAPARIAALPAETRAALAAAGQPVRPAGHGPTTGYGPAIDKLLTQPNGYHAGALRMEYPFRDVRLLRFFAGLPRAMFAARPQSRWMARELMRGRLPDTIVDRPRGMPASPEHMARLQRQASSARERIAGYRQIGVGDWLDLDWLDTALSRVAAEGAGGVDDANAVQMTAINAAWFAWWLNR